jgi:tetratricopeptide (TPR) repeat protein
MPFSRLVVVAGLVVLMAGCASVKPQSEAEYKQSMAAAEKTLEQKGADQAVAQFEEIAQRNPTKGEPWSYIAKIRFDEQKYGQAIVAADETLSRDPQDFVAKTVRAVGGLRVAMQSLADLRADTLLAGNARADAVALACFLKAVVRRRVANNNNARWSPPCRRPRRPRIALQRKPLRHLRPPLHPPRPNPLLHPPRSLIARRIPSAICSPSNSPQRAPRPVAHG